MQAATENNAGEIGRGIIRDLMGDAYLERRAQNPNPFGSVMQEFADEVCFGRVWARDGLERKLRCVITVAMMVALNRMGALRVHIEGALNNGCSEEEIKEILLQTAVYCGVPAAVEAFKVAGEVLAARQSQAQAQA